MDCPSGRQMRISGWGRYAAAEARVHSPDSQGSLNGCLFKLDSLIPRGLGRSYGDSSLNSDVIATGRLDRMLAFDEKEGLLKCQSGVSLAEMLDVFVSEGWFLPVAPGTKFVSLGGAIASDIHGKNHHREGSFSDHLASVEVMLPNGEVTACSKKENNELFKATCGGMGLTGFILNATLRMKKIETAFIKQKTLRAGNLDEIMDLFEGHKESSYSVAWIDCLAGGGRLGRGILMLGEHAERDEAQGGLSLKGGYKLNIPFDFPGLVLNSFTAKGFNAVYYNLHSRAHESLVGYDKFFFPLDGIHNWNRIYGSRGFAQYPFVLPKEAGREGCRRILHKIGASGRGAFLAVLKLFGRGNENLLSFPMEGYTLALDFPVTRNLFKFFDEMDEIVLAYGGRLYLTKDVRMSGEMFRKSYIDSARFMEYKHALDKAGKFRSLQSRRLGI